MSGRGVRRDREWEQTLRLIKLSGVHEGEGLRNKKTEASQRAFNFLPTHPQPREPTWFTSLKMLGT